MTQQVHVPDELAVRIDVIGHASPRWRGAKTPTEADQQNLKLSQLRSQNVRMAVEQILKIELPNVKIQLGSLGLGSFPPISMTDTDAAVDRIVLILINLTRKHTTWKNGPMRTEHVKTYYWGGNVRVWFGAAGVAAGILELELVNILQQKVKFKTLLVGAGGQIKFSPKPGPAAQKPSLSLKPELEGDTAFHVPNGANFDDFIDQDVIIGKAQIKLPILGGPDLNFISFPGLGTEHVHNTFASHAWKRGGVDWPSAAADNLFGKLEMVGKKPSELLRWNDPADLVLVRENLRGSISAWVLGFPTGKSSLNDLNPTIRDDFRSFVTKRARNIAIELETIAKNP